MVGLACCYMKNRNRNLHTMTRARFTEKVSIAHFLLKDGTKISVITNYNYAYGDLIKSFQINDKFETEVKDKYFDRFIPFDECCNLGGERGFENGSIAYEYLLKPLGIDTKDYPRSGKDGWDIHYSSFYHFKVAMINMGAVQLQAFPKNI